MIFFLAVAVVVISLSLILEAIALATASTIFLLNLFSFVSDWSAIVLVIKLLILWVEDTSVDELTISNEGTHYSFTNFLLFSLSFSKISLLATEYNSSSSSLSSLSKVASLFKLLHC